MSNHAFSSKVYNRQKFTIPKNSVYQIQFNGNNPNYYRVNNLGETVIYFATNNTPREDLYDFKCSPNSVANFAEPYTRDFLYCYNPNNVDVDILITYWEGEFDPAFIAFGESTLSVEGTVKTDGVVNAFNTSLPSGDNTIGLVGLRDTEKSVLDSISTDTSKIGGIASNLSIVLASTNTTRGYVDELRSKVDTLNGYIKDIHERYVGGLYYSKTFNIVNRMNVGTTLPISTSILNKATRWEYSITNNDNTKELNISFSGPGGEYLDEAMISPNDTYTYSKSILDYFDGNESVFDENVKLNSISFDVSETLNFTISLKLYTE